MGINQIAGLRPPKKATGGSAPSFHCFGLAIDINHPTNPFVGNKKPTLDADGNKTVTDEEQAKYEEFLQNRSPRIIERAMFLLRGEQFDVEQAISVPRDKAKDPVARAGHLWEVHHRASDTLAEYLRLADDLEGTRLSRPRRGPPRGGRHPRPPHLEAADRRRQGADQALGLHAPQATREDRIHGSR